MQVCVLPVVSVHVLSFRPLIGAMHTVPSGSSAAAATAPARLFLAPAHQHVPLMSGRCQHVTILSAPIIPMIPSVQARGVLLRSCILQPAAVTTVVLWRKFGGSERKAEQAGCIGRNFA